MPSRKEWAKLSWIWKVYSFANEFNAIFQPVFHLFLLCTQSIQIDSRLAWMALYWVISARKLHWHFSSEIKFTDNNLFTLWTCRCHLTIIRAAKIKSKSFECGNMFLFLFFCKWICLQFCHQRWIRFSERKKTTLKIMVHMKKTTYSISIDGK